MLAFERGAPRFDGALTLSRPAGAVLASGKAVAFEPWRLTSKVKADVSAAALDEVSFQYGPDERAVDARRLRRVQVRRAAAIAGHAVGAAGRSRPAAGDARSAAAPAAGGGAGVRRDARQRAAAVVAGEACAQRRRHDARRRDRAERRQRSALGRQHLDGRQAGVPRARLHAGQGRRPALSARQGARLCRRRQRQLQRSQESGGVARRASHHDRAVQAVARQGRRDAPGGPDRGRAAADRDRSRRGRGQRVLHVAGGRPAGASRWRASRGRARSRRRDRLWRVRAVRSGAGAAGRGRRWRWTSAAPRLPASTRATSPRVSSSMPADLRSSGCRSATSAIPASSPPAESRRSRRRAAASRSISMRATSTASWRWRNGSRRRWPIRCAGSRPARRPRRCKPASAWKAAAPTAPAARSA